MADFTYKNVTVTGADSLEAAIRQAATAWLQQFGEPTEQEIDTLLAQIEAEESERLDLSGLGTEISAEIAWLDATITNIDAYTAAQVRDVVKRLCQEQRRDLQAWRFVARRLA